MAKCVFGYRNRFDGGTLSGGSWETDYPLSNLKTNRLYQVARTTDALAASSIVLCTFTADTSVQLVAIMAHNFSLSAQIQIELLDASDVRVGGMSAAQDVYPSGLFHGTSTADKTEELASIPKMYVYLLSAAVSCRKVKISVTDTSNPEGYVQCGRVFAGPAYQPVNNVHYGLTDGIEAKTDVEETPTGARYFGDKRICRSFSGSFRLIRDDSSEFPVEAYTAMMQMFKTMGNSEPVVFCSDPGVTNLVMPWNSYFGYLTVGGVSRPQYGVADIDVSIEEVED